MDGRQELGRAIHVSRRRKGWTQAWLGSRVGESGRTIGHWEAGARVPDWMACQRLIDELDDMEFVFAVARFATGGLVGRTASAFSGVRPAAAMAVGVELAELKSDMEEAQSFWLADPAMADPKTVESLDMNLLDVEVTGNQLRIELYRFHQMSMRSSVAQHNKRLKLKGYETRKSHPLPRAA